MSCTWNSATNFEQFQKYFDQFSKSIGRPKQNYIKEIEYKSFFFNIYIYIYIVMYSCDVLYSSSQWTPWERSSERLWLEVKRMRPLLPTDVTRKMRDGIVLKSDSRAETRRCEGLETEKRNMNTWRDKASAVGKKRQQRINLIEHNFLSCLYI